MFETLSIAQLEKLLDEFSVPMFLIERQKTQGDFRITALNRAFEDLAGLSRQAFVGESLIKMAAAAAAEDTIEYYRQCVSTRQTIRFTSVLSFKRNQAYWDKTLQYSQSPEGHDRVIATAIKVPDTQPLLQDRLAFEDLSYFSSIVDLQLQNFSSAFENATQEARVSPIDEERIMRLHATCRTIQRTVSDIKKIVRSAQARHAPPAMPASGARCAQQHGPQSQKGLNMAQALTQALADENKKSA